MILDKRDRPLERFADPRVVLLDAAGEPVAKLDQAARDRNPALDHAPAWSLDRWRRETGYSPAPRPATSAARWMATKERRRIEAAFEALQADGIVACEKLPGGLYRPVPPGKVRREPNRRELLEAHRRRLDDAKQKRQKRQNKRRGLAGPGLFDCE